MKARRSPERGITPRSFVVITLPRHHFATMINLQWHQVAKWRSPSRK